MKNLYKCIASQTFHGQLWVSRTIKQDHNKSKMTKGSYLKQVIDETCNDVRKCEMTSMPPFKFEKFLNKEEHGGAHFKPSTFFCKTKMKGVAKQS
jgi:hypothetical protein